MFDFQSWIQEALIMAAGLLPFNMSITRASEKFGLAGKPQAAFGLITGLLLGLGLQVAVYGVPADFQGWFFAGLFGLMVGGGSIGTYEVIKKAVIKANGS